MANYSGGDKLPTYYCMKYQELVGKCWTRDRCIHNCGEYKHPHPDGEAILIHVCQWLRATNPDRTVYEGMRERELND